ncbi:MAG: hypothetical protein AAFR57_05480 [Pseudomonadota bacterium]
MTHPIAHHGGPLANPSMSSSSDQSSRAGKREHDRRALQMSFQMFFQERWIEFLKENFGSPEEIAVAFGVTGPTAKNWLDGSTAPRGHCVAKAFRDYPEQAAFLIGESAA